MVDEWQDDATMAVVAHGLLSSMALINGSAELLTERWDQLDDARRKRLLDNVCSQSAFVIEVLKDLARGLPPDVEAALKRER
jgi:K+-sensing histidine kinase KdpD